MSSSRDRIAIISSSRTPVGAFQGAFSSLSSPQLGASALADSLEKAAFTADDVSEVIMGCVLPAGVGQAPARQCALLANLPDSIPATTVNKVCGSGMKSIMYGIAQLAAREANVIVAGGMESMSNAPYLMNKVRSGLRLGHSQVQDHMFTDGLEDAYSGQLMGVFAQQTADRFSINREAMDDYALESLARAKQAIAKGHFDQEIKPIEVNSLFVAQDEQPDKAKPEKIRKLKPAFSANGTVTAANSSSISDGAAVVTLMRTSDAVSRGIKPIASVCGYHTHAGKPAEFTLAPINAINGLLDKLGWTHDSIDLYEINEAFAVVALLAIQKLNLNPKKVNINGGACALGHPLGASGARIVVTLLHALQRTGGKRGIASLCIGGGEATAMAVELC
ncbi:MAG: acetyl-CoA C-acyltransferase [Endozoicomonas sp. (ex Botrylloides leachii)]|nr:acetyl-CoA C-acyltransferase [Endozoicomonas sp. (ex Botrylloides leachii)]